MPTLLDAVKTLDMERQEIGSTMVKSAQQMSISASKSTEFHLVTVQVNRLPMLFASDAKNDGPIIVDSNKDRIGRLECNFIPKVIVLSGINAFKNAKRNKQKVVQVWAGFDALSKLKVKANTPLPTPRVPAGVEDRSLSQSSLDEMLFDRPNTEAPALGGFNGPITNYGATSNDFTNFGAPGSEANNPAYKLMLNVEEALRMYVAGIVNGVHKPLVSALAPIPPGLVNAAREAKIAAAEYSKMPIEFSPLDFIKWQHTQLSVKTKLMMKDGLLASEYAYVGDETDPSTWLLDVSSPLKMRLAASRVMETDGIPKKQRISIKAELEARDVKQSERKSLAKKGDALPDGSFPIKNKKDLANAEHLVGLSKHPSAARKLIDRRKKALDAAKVKADAQTMMQNAPVFNAKNKKKVKADAKKKSVAGTVIDGIY